MWCYVYIQYLHKHHIRSRRRASGRSPPRAPRAPQELPDAAKPWIGRALQGVGRPQCTRPYGPHQSLNRSQSQLKAHLRSHGHTNRVCSDWNSALPSAPQPARQVPRWLAMALPSPRPSCSWGCHRFVFTFYVPGTCPGLASHRWRSGLGYCGGAFGCPAGAPRRPGPGVAWHCGFLRLSMAASVWHPMWECCMCLGLNMANDSCHMGPTGAGRGAFGGAWRGRTMAFVWGKSVNVG